MARTPALIALLCCTFNCGPLAAQKPLRLEPLNQNAALSYWQAFALLPPIDDEMRKRLASCVAGEAPVDDDLRKLVDSSTNSLTYLYRGARIESCGWGVASENGPYAYLPHLSKARELARVALLRARIRFEAGQVDGGIDDSIAAIQLGRHAGQEGVIVLINILVGFAIESEAIGTIADSLHLLSQAQRNKFARRIDQIQPTLDMTTALQGEKDVFLGWMIRQLESGGSKDLILDLVSGDVDERITNRVNKASQEELLKWARDLGAIYDTGFGIMSLSPDEAMQKADELAAQLGDETTGNPLGELFLPSFGAARQAEAVFVTRKTMLKAAFALFGSDLSVLNRPAYRDPFGDGPLELKRVEGAAELVSDLKRGGEPIKLRVPGLQD